MIFDLILIILIIVALTRASAKGCTEDLNFAVGFLVIVRFAGIFYKPASKLFLKITDSEFLALFAAYITLMILLFFIFNAAAGNRIIELGKKIPKKTGLFLTYFFAVIRTIMIFSIIFGLIYTFPLLKRAPEKYITPKSYGLTESFLGGGTSELFHKLAAYLTEKVSAPVDFMARQKSKQVHGSSKTFDAAKSVDGFHEVKTEGIKQPAAQPKDPKQPEQKTEEANK